MFQHSQQAKNPHEHATKKPSPIRLELLFAGGQSIQFYTLVSQHFLESCLVRMLQVWCQFSLLLSMLVAALLDPAGLDLR